MAKKTKEIKKGDVLEVEEKVEEVNEEGEVKIEKSKKEAKKIDPTSSISATLDAIRSKFGDESIMKLGDKPKVNVNAISTGSIGLDAALGIGGLPRGRIIEIFGPESSGKTTLSLHVIAEAQKLNIPTFGIVDTNSDPTLVDYPIPANDDAAKSIALIAKYMTDAITEGLAERKREKDTEVDKEAISEKEEA